MRMNVISRAGMMMVLAVVGSVQPGPRGDAERPPSLSVPPGAKSPAVESPRGKSARLLRTRKFEDVVEHSETHCTGKEGQEGCFDLLLDRVYALHFLNRDVETLRAAGALLLLLKERVKAEELPLVLVTSNLDSLYAASLLRLGRIQEAYDFLGAHTFAGPLVAHGRDQLWWRMLAIDKASAWILPMPQVAYLLHRKEFEAAFLWMSALFSFDPALMKVPIDSIGSSALYQETVTGVSWQAVVRCYHAIVRGQACPSSDSLPETSAASIPSPGAIRGFYVTIFGPLPIENPLYSFGAYLAASNNPGRANAYLSEAAAVGGRRFFIKAQSDANFATALLAPNNPVLTQRAARQKPQLIVQALPLQGLEELVQATAADSGIGRSRSGTVQLFGTAGRIVRTVEPPAGFESNHLGPISVAPDSKYYALVSSSTNAYNKGLWILDQYGDTVLHAGTSSVSCAEFLTDHQIAYYDEYSGGLTQLDFINNVVVARRSKDASSIAFLAATHDRHGLLSATPLGVVCRWGKQFASSHCRNLSMALRGFKRSASGRNFLAIGEKQVLVLDESLTVRARVSSAEPIVSAALSPDESVIAVGTRGELVTSGVYGGPRRLLRKGKTFGSLSFGAGVLVGVNDEGYPWRMAPGSGRIYSSAFGSPDGIVGVGVLPARRVLIALRRGTLLALDAEGATRTEVRVSAGIRAMATHPGNKSVALLTDAGVVQLAGDPDAGAAPKPLARIADGQVIAMGAGDLLAAYTRQKKLLLFRAGRLLGSLPLGNDVPRVMRFSPKARVLAVGTAEGEVVLVDTQRLDISGRFAAGSAVTDWVSAIDFLSESVLLTGHAGLLGSPKGAPLRCWNLNGTRIAIPDLFATGDLRPKPRILLVRADLFSKRIAVVLSDEVRVYDFDFRISAILLPKSAIDDIHFEIGRPDFLTTFSRNGQLDVWNLSTSRAYTRVFSGGAHLGFLPDSYYRLSGPSAVHAVAFRKGLRAYGFDQFDLRFNRPDIVLERLNTPAEIAKDAELREKISRYKAYWEYRVRQNGFDPAQLSAQKEIHAPEVFDIRVDGLPRDPVRGKDGRYGASAPAETTKRTVELSFRIKDEAGKHCAGGKQVCDIIGYRIYVNGVPVDGQYATPVKPARILSMKRTIALSAHGSRSADPDGAGALAPGDNQIEISGMTSDGVESNRESVYIRYTGPDIQRKPKLYVVALGIDDYSRSDGFGSLTYAEKDAGDIVDMFRKSAGSRYAEVVPILRRDGKDGRLNRATLRDIRSTLERTTVDDTVVFFLAGHGLRAPTPRKALEAMAVEFRMRAEVLGTSERAGMTDVYYYMPGDGSATRPWERAIPMEAIRQVLDGIPARQKLLLVDTCQSGERIELAGYRPTKTELAAAGGKRAAFKKQAAGRGIRLVHRGEFTERGVVVAMAYSRTLQEMSEMFPELRRGTGTIEISASTGAQAALESSEWKNGAFTFALKEAVLGGQAKRSGVVSAGSLRAYVLRRVEELTQGAQTPMVARDIAGRDWTVVE